MAEYVKGPPPDRWHWNKNCRQYPPVIIQKRATKPSKDLCDECRDLERRQKYVVERSGFKVVKEIMSKDITTIAPEASLACAALTMGEKRTGSLIVTKYEAPVGIITERDLLSKVLALGKDLKEEKVETAMSYPLITIESSLKIKEAAKKMIQKKRRLAVFEGGQLVGIVTAADLTKSLPEVSETTVKVDDFMTKQVKTVDENTSLEAVVKILGEERIGSVIVTSNKKPFGIFTERDLFSKILVKNKPLTSKVGDEASSPLITAQVGTSIHDAAVTMALKHIRRLPVESDGKIVGIITARDLVEAYAK